MSTLTAFRWTGEAMEPLPRFRKECDREFVIGQVYLMEPMEERSSASHRHFFAVVNECWQNLPEELSGEFPNPEVLRKHALIRTGFCDVQSILLNSKAEALRVKDFLDRAPGEYALTSINGTTVTRLTAQSQSMKAMGKERFQDSKDKVLGFLADMLGTTQDELTKVAARPKKKGKFE